MHLADTFILRNLIYFLSFHEFYQFINQTRGICVAVLSELQERYILTWLAMLHSQIY